MPVSASSIQAGTGVRSAPFWRGIIESWIASRAGRAVNCRAAGRAMPKPSNREVILTEGLRVVLERGFCGASVRDVVHAAGVPQGSFTNHFASKEAFGLEILDLYFAQVRDGIRKTLRNDALPPLDRLRAWADLQIRFLEKAEMRNGCLIGNFSIEAADHSEAIRRRLVEIFDEIQQAIAYRSDERRAGKECRSRRSPYPSNQNPHP